MNRRRLVQALSASPLYLFGGASLWKCVESLKWSGAGTMKPAAASLTIDTPFDLMSLKLDSRNIRAAIPVLKTLSREQRLALLPEARRQEGFRFKEDFSGSPLYSQYSDEHWLEMGSSYSPKFLLDDPPWPTFFQHLRGATTSVEHCIKTGIAVPSDADWIYVGKFKEGVDESLCSPVRVWVARKGEQYFLKIDDGTVAEEKARHDFNLVRLIEHIAPAGLDDLKRAVAGRPGFYMVAKITDSRLRYQRENDGKR